MSRDAACTNRLDCSFSLFGSTNFYRLIFLCFQTFTSPIDWVQSTSWTQWINLLKTCRHMRSVSSAPSLLLIEAIFETITSVNPPIQWQCAVLIAAVHQKTSPVTTAFIFNCNLAQIHNPSSCCSHYLSCLLLIHQLPHRQQTFLTQTFCWRTKTKRFCFSQSSLIQSY